MSEFPHRRFQGGNEGFTLTEVVLAMAIFGLIFVMVAGVFFQGNKVLKRVESRAETEAMDILSTVSRDIRSAYIPSGKEQPVFAFVGGPVAVHFVCAVPLTEGHRGIGGDLRWVSYYLRPGLRRETYELVRRDDAAPREDARPLEEGDVLASAVTSLKWTYFDGKKWLSTWGALHALPRAVHIELELTDGEGRKSVKKFTTTFQPMCA
jgi:prepilin-type N-terminal cleavage/methylation domain-containing protein